MAKSIQTRLSEAMEFLKRGLYPYLEREMKEVYGKNWESEAAQSIREDHGGLAKNKKAKQNQINWDVANILHVMWDQWNTVFKRTLGHAERSYVSELRDARNRWAHQDEFTNSDLLRVLDTMQRLLEAVSAGELAAEVNKEHNAVMRQVIDDQRRHETKRAVTKLTEGTPDGVLKPWRDVIMPHPDVAGGRYQQAEFAADLWQVYLREAAPEYQKPQEFFRRTFITEGLKKLLTGAVDRLGRGGGDPVVELQTNFGGGKTHSMLALYHLFSGAPIRDLPGMEELFPNVKLPAPVNRAVFVGTKVSPGNPVTKPDGTVIRTLWGEIAWQLGGKTGYKMIQKDDENATNPGDRMKEVFNRFSPCLILIDEWVAYARQLHEGSNLPAGSFDTQFTFAQTLSESAKAANNTLLLVSIPASDNEIGGDWGNRALERLKNAIGRVEATWKPATANEGFEIVRRRLFETIAGPDLERARDLVASTFVKMYGAAKNEYPTGTWEAEYEDRIKRAYPIHPELFERLYSDWSTLDKFQRTRGVLRLMATVIHSLWERQDKNLLILPSMVPIDDPVVQRELTRYLDDHWGPVIDTDIDGELSTPLALDQEIGNLGRYSASRRVARTIYIGSAPHKEAANRGIDETLINLGCVQPGEPVATFGDALRRLSNKATYLYQEGKRYWFSTQPTLNRRADDRARQCSEYEVHAEIIRRLKVIAKKPHEFEKVYVCVPSSDIPEEHAARLVVLDPEYVHKNKPTIGSGKSPAMERAKEILENRGNSPRNYRNTLVFLGPDANRLAELDQSVRSYLAWQAIDAEQELLNLDKYQLKQVKAKLKEYNETIDLRIPETYCWFLNPEQPDPTRSYHIETYQMRGNEHLVERVCRKMRQDETLISHLAGTVLRSEMDRIPLWRDGEEKERVLVKQLADDFATLIYLPRLKSRQVFFEAIRNGVAHALPEETFVFAESYDTKKNRYTGLVTRKLPASLESPGALLVKWEAVKDQLEPESSTATVGGLPLAPQSGNKTPTEEKPEVEAKKRFYGSVELDPQRVLKEVDTIVKEVLQHLTKHPDAEIKIVFDIDARFEKAVDEKTIRDVTENCNTLRFQEASFEKE